MPWLPHYPSRGGLYSADTTFSRKSSFNLDLTKTFKIRDLDRFEADNIKTCI